ncbi:MAG TPA: nicotinate (nicotinamide) nucleotide adenylyltransferase [Candidatus Limnocylindria bacterium]|nr:nicotinate (nicotinamide) nucleotide adenylyltransferase [Candidatus Limnocylindria bacterium]
MRIGLYGGSFDPVHLGHLLVAQAAMEEMSLDRVMFIPASQSPFKLGQQLAPAALRLKWLRLALAGQTWADVDDFEAGRGGVSYTIDTVREMRRRFPQAQLAWLIGADHVNTLSQWREASELAEAVEFIVIPRPGIASVPVDSRLRLKHLRGWPVSVSASEIRARIGRRLTVAHLLPSSVDEAIRLDGAYRAA